MSAIGLPAQPVDATLRILTGKDGVYDDTARIFSRLHCGRENGDFGSDNADRAVFCLVVGILDRRSNNRSSATLFKRVSTCIACSSGQLRWRGSPRRLANRPP